MWSAEKEEEREEKEEKKEKKEEEKELVFPLKPLPASDVGEQL